MPTASPAPIFAASPVARSHLGAQGLGGHVLGVEAGLPLQDLAAYGPRLGRLLPRLQPGVCLASHRGVMLLQQRRNRLRKLRRHGFKWWLGPGGAAR